MLLGPPNVRAQPVPPARCIAASCTRFRHTSRFLMVYILVGLPLLLWPLARWCSTALSVLISFLLLGVEHIAAHIEEPFHVSGKCVRGVLCTL